MASRFAKRSITALAGLALAAVALVAALPFIASTQIVRDRIAQEFSNWSGYRVTVHGVPRIDVWPSIRAELPDVALSGWGATDQPPVLTSRTVEIDLSAIAALRGDIVPVKVRFVDPELRMARGEGGLPALRSPAGGKLRRAVEMARVAVDENPADPDLSAIRSSAFGVVEFSGARIVETDGAEGGEKELLTGLTGSMQWSAFDRGLSLNATGMMNDEEIRIESQITQPVLLLAGATAQLSFSLQSAPLQVSYNGVADIEAPLFIDGEIQFATPSLSDMLAWAGYDIGGMAAVGKTAISGRLHGQVGAVKIEDARITIGDNPGRGLVEVALSEGPPVVSGTLAFDDLDLVSFLSAFSVLPASSSLSTETLEESLLGKFNLDMRLSAGNASAGPVQLANVAAAVQIRDNLATFDISDATGFGGNISTGIRIDRASGRQTGEFRLLASGIDSAALAAAAGFKRMIPQARAKISVILNGPLATPDAFLRTASGSIAATFDTGTIADVDLAALLERARHGGFFALDDIGGGTLAFERAELKATMANGVATVEKAEARTARQMIVLSGLMPYVGRSLALSGRILPTSGQDGEAIDISFFVGGSWNAPFISAVLPPRIDE
ncbi:MAG: AsmA-like C-terminal region-containing protein [Rhizobiaceae bacterium]